MHVVEACGFSTLLATCQYHLASSCTNKFSKKTDCPTVIKGPAPVVYQSHNRQADAKVIIILLAIMVDFPRILYNNFIIVSLHYGI